MSRSNPLKKKRRVAGRTLLVCGEGLNEEIFLKYLRSLYARDSGVGVTIRNGKGGNAVNIVIGAANNFGDFDKRVVVLDNDRGDEEMRLAKEEATNRGIEMIENTPCLEAILLAILNGGKSYGNKQTSWCKKQFQLKYMEKKKRTELSEYGKIFPKKLLDEQQSRVFELKRIISVMRGIWI